jgi:uncharacterized repeat protein (TIGR04138 family)
MLCDRCNERHATVHLTQIIGDKVTKQDLCAICGKDFLGTAKTHEHFSIVPEAEQLFENTAARDPRYAKGAYHFVREGFIRAGKKRYGTACGAVHISTSELLEALREVAIETFGAKAKVKLNGWGVFKCEDFGEIVFSLVETGLVAKQTLDEKAGFQGGYGFNEAFPS